MTSKLRSIPILLVLLLLSGCTSMATQGLAESVSSALMEQDDPETARAAIPTYLVLMDGMVADSPDNPGLLQTSARLYAAMAALLENQPIRATKLSDHAFKRASRALCINQTTICEQQSGPYPAFKSTILQSDDWESLYLYATSWASYIQHHSDDWSAIADLPKVALILQHITDHQPDYDRGRAQLYLGILGSQLSPAMGGKPEVGREHFEQALNFSQGRDLRAKVEYARHYARLVFDQVLHDRLLNEVLAADPVEPELTLSNTLAQEQARTLLADEYF